MRIYQQPNTTLLQVSDPKDSQFYKQFQKNDAFKEEALAMIADEVLPAFKKLGDYVHGDYYACLRPRAGVHSVRNNGQELYQGFIDYHNQLDGLYPNDIYDYGIQELDKATARFVELAAILGYGDDLSFSEAVEAATNDPDSFFKTKEAVLQVRFYHSWSPHPLADMNWICP